MLPALLASPEYTAVIEWLPATSVFVVHCACPLASATAPHVPIVVAPSLKLTVPVGFAPVTVVVSVTFWPAVTGLADGVTAVVDAALTVWPTADILPLKLASPP